MMTMRVHMSNYIALDLMNYVYLNGIRLDLMADNEICSTTRSDLKIVMAVRSNSLGQRNLL